MAKRGAATELNHDNWDNEEEPEEAGTFTQADNETLKGRVIKKAKRRNPGGGEGGPSIFAGFGGFKAPAAGAATTGGSFDFLKTGSGSASSNGSGATASFSFTSPTGTGSAAPAPASGTGFTFGSVASDSSKTSNADKPDAAVFATKSDASKSAMFSFGSDSKDGEAKKTETTGSGLFSFGKKAVEESGKVKEKETPESTSNPIASTPAVPSIPISNPIVMPKTDKWTCSVCMVPNKADADSCACCSEPKPGSKPKAAATPAAPAAPSAGSVTSSGFKMGDFSAAPAPTSGFNFGTKATDDKPKSEMKVSKPKSGVYLAHLKALNTQVVKWIKDHVDKNPYVILSPVFTDYEKHIKELEEKHGGDSKNGSVEQKGFTFGGSPKSESAKDKPLLGAVFGNSAASSTEPVKFGNSSNFTFRSTDSTTTKKSTEEDAGKKTGFTFGSTSADSKASTPASTGFSFGSSSADKKGADKPAATTGFSFGGSAASTAANFSFGSKAAGTTGSESTAKTGFSFGSTATTVPGGSGTGFSFGSSSGTATSGFSFGAPPAGSATSSDAKTSENKDEDEEEEPPKVEVKTVEEDGAFHSVRCKLFYKKEKEFKEKGLGMLHLKKADDKTQMLVRAETNLGNILLNILVNDKMNLMKRKNNLQFVCVPNPPIPGQEGPVSMLIKVKDALMADQLEEKLKEAIQA